MIRSLTFSRSKWSVSSTSRACSRSRLSSVYVAPRQRQDPLEVGADDAVLGRGGRQLLEPRRARGRRPCAPPPGSSPRRRAARAARSTSACSGSPSPSSCWIAFSCWRRKYSRWPFSISDCTCDWIFEPSSNTSSSRLRIAETVRSRCSTFDLLEDLLPLLGLDRAQRRCDEMRRARSGRRRSPRRAAAPPGRYGASPMMRAKSPWTLRVSASTSGVSVRTSGSGLNSPRRYGSMSRRCVEPRRGRGPGRGSAASRRAP